MDQYPEIMGAREIGGGCTMHLKYQHVCACACVFITEGPGRWSLHRGGGLYFTAQCDKGTQVLPHIESIYPNNACQQCISMHVGVVWVFLS